MKTFILTYLLIAASLISSANVINVKMKTEEKIIAIFNGITEEGEFEFEDMEGNLYYFQEIKEDIEINLFDDSLIGKKFEVTWIEYTYEPEDENDYDDTYSINKIIQLKEL